jgi:hypothetical protein
LLSACIDVAASALPSRSLSSRFWQTITVPGIVVGALSRSFVLFDWRARWDPTAQARAPCHSDMASARAGAVQRSGVVRERAGLEHCSRKLQAGRGLCANVCYTVDDILLSESQDLAAQVLVEARDMEGNLSIK